MRRNRRRGRGGAVGGGGVYSETCCRCVEGAQYGLTDPGYLCSYCLFTKLPSVMDEPNILRRRGLQVSMMMMKMMRMMMMRVMVMMIIITRKILMMLRVKMKMLRMMMVMMILQKNYHQMHCRHR